MINQSEAKFPIVIDRALPADLRLNMEDHGTFRTGSHFWFVKCKNFRV